MSDGAPEQDRVEAEVVHYSPQRTLRLFSGVIHPNHLCALGGLCGDYFPPPRAVSPRLAAVSESYSR